MSVSRKIRMTDINYISMLFLTNNSDSSSNDIIEWMLHFSISLNRINHEDEINNYTYKLVNGKQEAWIDFRSTDRKIKITDSDGYLYRRGEVNRFPLPLLESDVTPVQKSIKLELTYLSKHIYSILDNKNVRFDTINQQIELDKIHMLHLASKNDIKVPDTIISNSKKDIRNFIVRKKRFISKAIYNMYRFELVETFRLLPPVPIEEYEGLFDDDGLIFPTLVQERIEKEYEIRCFFINDELFPMAIFSQQSEKTELDYRNYDLEKPNRCVPYKFPQNFNNKLLKLILDSGFKTGSIDLIKSIDNTYFFLELNPIGQFGWVSYNCNYYIERAIAKYFQHA